MEKKRGGEFIANRKKKLELENGFLTHSDNGTKCVEWTYIPVIAIPTMKTNVLLATKRINKTMNGGRMLLSKTVSI